MCIEKRKKCIVVVGLMLVCGFVFGSYGADFTDDHNDGVISGWTSYGQQNYWSESNNQMKFTQTNPQGNGQILSDYNCKDDGTLEVVINIGSWDASKAGGILFRWTGSNSFYYVYFYNQSDNSGNISIYLLENQLATTGGILIASNISCNKTFTFKLIIDDSQFDFYINNNQVSSRTDGSHTSGKVGYGHYNAYNSNIGFDNITWTDMHHPPTDILLPDNEVNENVSLGTIVGNFSTVDPDNPNDIHIYTLVSGTGSSGNSSFKINVGDSSLLTNAPFNYESQSSYSIRVKSTDLGNYDITKVFTINIINVNEAPTDISFDNNTINENAGTNAPVGNFSTDDEDVGQSHSYSLRSGSGDTDNSKFNISNNILRATNSLDFEAQETYSIRVRTTESSGGSLWYEKIFTITAINQNDIPTDITLTSQSVLEQELVGTVVGILSSADQDVSDNHSYSLVAGDIGSFTIDNNSLKTNAVFDYEIQNSYTVTIETNDGNGGTYQKQFTITVIELNETPTDINITATAIDENVPTGTTIGALSTVDPNVGQNFTYELFAGTGDADNGKFSISGEELQTAVPIDFETQSSFSIRVKTTDDGLPLPLSFEKIFTITVNNINEAPTDITLSSTNVLETAPVGTLVGLLGTVDQDTGQGHVYTLTAGATDSFSIVNDSLRTALLFDFEAIPSYNLTIRTNDQNGGTFQKQFAITIVDQNDAPTDISLTGTTVDENKDSGTVVGTFSTTDPDVGQGHTYSFVNGTGDTDNVKFTITGNTLQIAVKPDYEIQNSFSIRIRSTDNGTNPLFVEKVFIITINNANDPPTDITLVPDTVSENLAPGRFVGKLSAVDQDAGDTHTFTPAAGGIHNDSFAIRNDSLFTAAYLDFETTPTLTIKVRATDAGSGIYEKDITITVVDQNVAPVITSSFPADTVIPMDSIVTMTGAATGEPGPYYTWYHLHPDSVAADSVGAGAVFTIDITAKPDSGYYYFKAYNLAGTDWSDSIFVNVVRSATITLDLPTQYPAINGGVAVLSVGATGDGLMFYQWYADSVIMQGETNSSLTINPVDSTQHHGKTYYCEVWNTYSGKLLGSVTSTHCQIMVGRFYNPFKVLAESMGAQNNAQVRVKLWSEIDISGFPTTASISPWADSVWVLYKTSGYATSVTSAGVAMFSTQEIKDAAPDSLEKVLTVGSLVQPHDSCYWFNYSVVWHRPASGKDTLLEPFAPAGKVFMLDTLGPPNLLVIHGEYVMKTDTALLHIDSIAKLDAGKDSLVILQCSKFPGFVPLLYDTTLGVPALLAVGNSTTLVVDDIGNLPIEQQPVYCRWRVIGTNNALGKLSDTTFTIGWPRPVYTGRLLADSTKFGGEIHFSWTRPVTPVDSMRIWWDNDTIPLDYSFQIPLTQSNLLDTSLTIDTVKGLDNNKRYCLGLQIFRDDMWSEVTDKSRAWAKTALGDTTIVPNIISVDSSWFEDSTNALMIRWYIDTLKAPGDRTYQFGYIVSLDSATVMDTNQTITQWNDVTQKVNVTRIKLFPDIVFDTTYVVGLWLRGFSKVLGPGKKSPPTDTSTVFQKSPPFTWELIDIFDIGVDTVWVANQMIFLKKIEPFNLVDTLKAFDPGILPVGFVNVGGVSFQFTITNPDIPPFILGLKYDSLPNGITENDLGMYQYKNGQIHVVHGFQVSGGMVWDTVTSVDLAYPFLILADMLKPVVYGLEANSDTINSGTNIPTWFSIKDNIANVYWQFRYGPGDAGYDFGAGDTLNSPVDTALKAFIMYTTNAISEVYGVRAIIAVSDGVHLDTTNVSRSVRSTAVDTIGILANEWEQVRATAYLNEPALDQIFTISSGTTQQWTYDIYNYRLYRWYSYDTKNSWMEYADSVKDNFELVPGRLIWCKTAADQTLWMSGGVTTSLKQPYEIELKPNNWTDLCLPYKFPIMLRDILEANPGVLDSLEIYHWKKSGIIYEAVEKYIAIFDSIVDVIDTIQTGRKNDGYTFYNHGSTPVVLKIPPLSLPLSRYASSKRREATHSEHSWQVHFMWKNHGAGEDAFFRRIRCGYRKSKSSDQQFGFMPPTMSSVQVGIRDTRRNKLSGWSLQPSLKDGGISFEVCFANNGVKATEIEYFLDNLDAVPEGFTAKMLDPKTQKYEEFTAEKRALIAVNPKSSTSRIIVIGTDDYIKSLIKAYLPLKFIKAYPNPFNGRIKIQYRIPLGIKEVHFTLYNLRGQQLWKSIERKLTPGYHTVLFDGRTGMKRGVLPSGVYIMRMTAKNKAGKIIYGGKKRLTCIK